MKTILDTIVEHKRMEVLKRRQKKPLSALEDKPFYHREPLDAPARLRTDAPAVIAEFKRKSPSRGMINFSVTPAPIVQAYAAGGASAVSVLTDRDFFGGSFRDLERAREVAGDMPLLRKDFMVDPYQVHEAKAYGADIILLIASVLEAGRVEELAGLAVELGMSVLFEVHGEEELKKYTGSIGMVGVNNRDLSSFNVDVALSERLAARLPEGVVKVSESGLKDAATIRKLHELGYQAFLVGETFMKEEEPGRAVEQLCAQLKS